MKWVLSEYDPEMLADIIIDRLKRRGYYWRHNITDRAWEYWNTPNIQVLCIYSQRIRNIGKPNSIYCSLLGIRMRKDYMILKSFGGSIYRISLNELKPALKSNIKNNK